MRAAEKGDVISCYTDILNILYRRLVKSPPAQEITPLRTHPKMMIITLQLSIYVYIPWPFPPLWGVADNTERQQKQWGFYSGLLAMTRDPAEFGWHCRSNTALPPPVFNYKPHLSGPIFKFLQLESVFKLWPENYTLSLLNFNESIFWQVSTATEYSALHGGLATFLIYKRGEKLLEIFKLWINF